MAPYRCNIRSFLNLGLSPRLVALVLGVVSVSFSVTESAPPLHLRGEVGGNVTFRCPSHENGKIAFFYLQHDEKFVNGYYASKEITAIWENTRLEPNQTHVHMYRLSIKDGGEYKCIIQYDGSSSISEESIQLNVTATYSKPTVTTSCDDDDDDDNLGLSCFITCASHGGYPGTRMMWNIPVSRNASSQTWRVVSSSELQSPSTMMFNSSSTANFNCSSGELEYLSCSVGNVMSNFFSVCKPKVKPTSFRTVIAVACVVLGVFMIVVGLLLYRRCRKRKTGDAANGRQEPKVNGSVEEGVDLKDRGGEEAS